MAYEQVGPGYSSGVVPDYASHLGADQSAYANQFSQYTNPFLNAQGVQGEILPWMRQALEQKQQASQQSYQQGMLGVEQARQNMAQTAQDKLLPLQANQLDATTSEIQSRAALMNYGLDQDKAANQATPEVLGALAPYLAKGDYAGALTSLNSVPGAGAVIQKSPQLIQGLLGHADQLNTIQTQLAYNAAKAQGAASAFDVPAGTSLSDFIAQKYPPPDMSDPAAVAKWSAGIEGISGQYSATQQMMAKGALTQAAIELKSKGTIDADLLNTLRTGLGTGKISPAMLAAADVDPITAAKIQAAMASDQASGAIIPDKTAVTNLTLAQKILASPTATTAEKNWAYDSLSNNGKPSYQFTILPGPVQDKVDSINQQITALTNSLPQRGTTSFFGTSDYDTTLGQINDLRDQVMAIKNQYAPAQALQPKQTPAADGQGQPQAQSNQLTIPAPAASFGQNSFGAGGVDLGGGMSIPAPAASLDQSGTDLTNAAMSGQSAPPITLPGNPNTSAALNAQRKTAPPAPKGQASPQAQSRPQPDPMKAKMLADQIDSAGGLGSPMGQMLEQRWDGIYGKGSAAQMYGNVKSTTARQPQTMVA